MLEHKIQQWALQFLKANLEDDVVDMLNENNSKDWDDDQWEAYLEDLIERNNESEKLNLLDDLKTDISQGTQWIHRLELYGDGLCNIIGQNPYGNNEDLAREIPCDQIHQTLDKLIAEAQ